jgi:hypothetical protein
MRMIMMMPRGVAVCAMLVVGPFRTCQPVRHGDTKLHAIAEVGRLHAFGDARVEDDQAAARPQTCPFRLRAAVRSSRQRQRRRGLSLRAKSADTLASPSR